MSKLLVLAESVEHGEPAVSPYVVGGGILLILLLLMLGLLMFGKGREHA